MEKQKRWQFLLIVAVLALTIYNILPTIFYYSQPLKSPIDEKRAEKIATTIVNRVNSQEQNSKEWLASFCNLLGIKPESIELKKGNPGLFEVTFKNTQDANRFSRFLPKAGSLIPFVPAQLELYPDGMDKTVLVKRMINVHLDPKETEKLFNFSPKFDAGGELTGIYRNLVYDRVEQLALGFGGPSTGAIQLTALSENAQGINPDELTLSVAREIADIQNAFGADSPIAKRAFANFTQISGVNSGKLIDNFLTRAEKLKGGLKTQKEALESLQKELSEKGQPSDTEREIKIASLEGSIRALNQATAAINKNKSVFTKGQAPLTSGTIAKELAASAAKINPADLQQVVDLEGRNPLIQALVIDWSNDRILTKFYDDVETVRESEGKTEREAYAKEKANQMVISEIARVSRAADESIIPYNDNFSVKLSTITNSQSLLAFDLGTLAEKQTEQLTSQIQNQWSPDHQDLQSSVYPIYDWKAYDKLSPEEKQLGLVIYAPAMHGESPPEGFKTSSIYVIAKGMEPIISRYKDRPESEEGQVLLGDVQSLGQLLQRNGFIGYPGTLYGVDPEFKKDFIFELDDYFSNVLTATREDFQVKGSKRYATLDFTDVEQRILTQNKIGDKIQENLVKWKEDYGTSQVDLNTANQFLVPPPTKNVYWENIKLSATKYFRGDSDKVLKWGLDLSGGKTVRIGLRDQNNRVVTDPDDLKQAVNELYTRVNKLGVSETTIRIENENIILDFPGSQGLSASDLIKASAMYFHIVNEKFSRSNTELKGAVEQFLQSVWNEAVVTNRKDIESINDIAWQQLGGELAGGTQTRPRSEAAKTLYENGLRLADPRHSVASNTFDDSLSRVVMYPGSDYTEWEGQSNPLMIAFFNYALEGSSLTNVSASYDPSNGNILNFGVKRSFEGSNRTGNPREEFYAWTSRFAEDQIQGTKKEAYSQGRGWRMAVVLNDRVISAPSLKAALRDGGMISGRFTQREVNQLAADLKAGSLSFTPKILSEQNVSPELGIEERTKGIMASLIALVLVFAVMIGYYRFAGVVASFAVVINLLIMWGVLQNLDAALTLPGIAAIVLTIGMAVDANVLVFERVREEFKHSAKIATALQAGYRKAFSAIIDSNITTIIAALILIQFDSGPIKGFAVTLIIGILSSMFTALFMTRYFFAGWVQNPKHTQLSMSEWISNTKFDFIGKAKIAVILSVIVMVVGGYFFYTQRNTIFGMDFTGGYSLQVEVEEQLDNPPYRVEAINALLKSGATPNDFDIRELSRPDQLLIQLSMGIEEPGHPFYQMPEVLTNGKFTYDYEKNPRIVWIVNALESHGLKVQKSQLENLDKQWNAMGAQFSDAMRNNAIIALSLALFSILVYITFRFEFKYAIAAVIALAHDVFITLGIFAMIHRMGFPVQIDLQVIGAIMTIIGYSLNDTIIIFDRIREDIRVLRKWKFQDIVNHALNVTLGRTMMTSGTTLVVLFALVLLGGQSIFAFSLVMTIGVLIGTLSSLFVAAPVMLYFHNREEERDLSHKHA